MNLRLKVSPVVLTFATAALMAAVDHVMPQCRVRLPAREIIALVLVGAALVIGAAAGRRFIEARTTVMPFRPEEATALVTTGIYGRTRNPMYLALVVLLTGLAVWLANPACALLLPLFVAYLSRFQIAPEEAALRRSFGPAYTDYQRRVRRWL